MHMIYNYRDDLDSRSSRLEQFDAMGSAPELASPIFFPIFIRTIGYLPRLYTIPLDPLFSPIARLHHADDLQLQR